MNTTQTAGQALTAELRRYFQVGARTRSHRNGADVKRDMLQAIEYAITFPGYYAERTEQALRPASGALRSWQKHVEGYRIDGVLAYQLRSLTPYQFAAYLGRMVDAGITNVGEGERFFQAEARTARVAA